MENLMSMGFSDVDSRIALTKKGGDIDQAIEFLLNNSSSNESEPVVLSNESEIVGHFALSQFSFEGYGSSACTSISVAVGMNILELLENGLSPQELLQKIPLLTESLFQGLEYYTTINCQRLGQSNNEHLSIEDVYDNIPEFKGKVKKINDLPSQGIISSSASFQSFFNNIRSLGDNKRFTVVFLTKSPETICIILPPVGSEHLGYILFDSHCRPQYGMENAYFIIAKNLIALCDRLLVLFPALQSETGYEDSYHLSMYNSYEGTPFQINSTIDHGQKIIEIEIELNENENILDNKNITLSNVSEDLISQETSEEADWVVVPSSVINDQMNDESNVEKIV